MKHEPGLRKSRSLAIVGGNPARTALRKQREA